MATQNWESLVRQADPDFDKPGVAYRFSNGRKFKQAREPYSAASVPFVWDQFYWNKGATWGE